MKLSFLFIAVVYMCSTVFSEEAGDVSTLQIPQEDSDQFIKQYEPISTSNIYFKIGTSILYQGVGVGYRFKDEITNVGYDVALNVKVMPFIFGHHALSRPITTIEYTRLFYKKSFAFVDYCKYSGLGIEFGALIREGRDHHLLPIVNPKIVWGREYISGQFSQGSLNLIPTAVFLVGTGVAIVDKKRDHREIGVVAGLYGLSCMFEYTYGF